MLASLLLLAVHAPRLVIVSWDGAPDYVLDQLLLDGKLPNVARLIANGVRADYCTPTFPSKTAAGHFAIFSGTTPAKSGVTNNSVPLLPRNEHTILESTTGFGGSVHQTEPLWVTAAKAGKKVLVLSAAGSYPPEADQARLATAKVAKDRFVEFSGFESSIENDKVVHGTGGKLEFTMGETKFTATPVSSAGRFASLTVTSADGKTAKLEPHEADRKLEFWSAPFWITKSDLGGFTYFRLYDLNPDSGEFHLCVRGAAGIKGTPSNAEIKQYQEAYGGFHGDPLRMYQRGELGPTLAEDGNGTAEKRLTELIWLDCEFLKRSFRYGWKHYRPDILFHYQPMTDSAGHTWMGVLDPWSPSYNLKLAMKILPYYEEIFRLEDAWLGDMMDLAGPNTAFALVSDHGMAGRSRLFGVNRVLESAGLLVKNPDGTVDLSRTKALLPSWSDFGVVINDSSWKGGIVPRAERPEILQQVETALLSAREPNTGLPIVRSIFRPDQLTGLGIGGASGADLYFDLAPGIYPSTRLNSPLIEFTGKGFANGDHGFYPQRRSMQAIFFLGGPGVRKNAVIPGMRQIDIAPTLCALLGIEPSPDYEGHILGEAFPSRK
jgi:predicted AlkP superfamily phosphohydrolase/phosphomutase